MKQRDFLSLLRSARRLIRDRHHWCQRAMARTASGGRVTPTSPEAIQFCAAGALYRVAQKGTDYLELRDYLETLERDSIDLAEVNDGPDGHQRVLALFEKGLHQLQAQLKKKRKRVAAVCMVRRENRRRHVHADETQPAAPLNPWGRSSQ